MEQSEETREAGAAASEDVQEHTSGQTESGVPAGQHADDGAENAGEPISGPDEPAPQEQARDEQSSEELSPEGPSEDSGEAQDADDDDTIFVAETVIEALPEENPDDLLKAVIEAAIYITDEPLTLDQIASAVEQPVERVKTILARLAEEYARPDRGLTVRELAGGYKMGTKPEHHERIRQFVKKLQPPLKLSLPALETLAVVAYKQPITAPEIMEIRGVQGTGVLKTLLDRKLIATAGRKDVVGKPIMYKTTKEFLVQFGLSSLKELPTLKEFEELGRLALSDETPEADPGKPFTSAPLPAEESENVSEDAQAAPQPEDETQPVIEVGAVEAPDNSESADNPELQQQEAEPGAEPQRDGEPDA